MREEIHHQVVKNLQDLLQKKSSNENSRNKRLEESYEQNEEATTALNWPWGNKTNSLTWRWLISPELVARTFLASSRYRFDFNFGFGLKGDWRSGSESGTYDEKFEFDFYDIVNDNTIETELSWYGIENHQIMVGFQIKKVDYDLGMDFKFQTLDTLLNLSPLGQKDNTVESSLFLQDKWNLNQRIILQIGGRFMDYSEHDELYFDPRLGIKYLAQENLSYKLSLGRYHQFLTIANPEDETWRIIDFWLGITEEQKAPYSDHYILGLEYLSEDNWLFRCETYYKHFENLITLPGIGKSTAGAILSIAYKLPYPILDANVKRVLTRLFFKTNSNEKELWDLSSQILDKKNVDDFQQGIMDLGATVCTPKNALCGECPLNKQCISFSKGELPTVNVKKIN